MKSFRELARDIRGQARVSDIVLSPGMALALLFLVGFLSGYIIRSALVFAPLEIAEWTGVIEIAIPVLVAIVLISLMVGAIAAGAAKRRR